MSPLRTPDGTEAGSSSSRSPRRLHRPPFPSGWHSLDLVPHDLVLAHTLPVGQSFLWHRRALAPTGVSSSKVEEEAAAAAAVARRERLPESGLKKGFKREIQEDDVTTRIKLGDALESSSPATVGPLDAPHPPVVCESREVEAGLVKQEPADDEVPIRPRVPQGEDEEEQKTVTVREEYSRAIGGRGGEQDEDDVDPLHAGPPRILCLRQDELSGRVWYTSIRPWSTSANGGVARNDDGKAGSEEHLASGALETRPAKRQRTTASSSNCPSELRAQSKGRDAIDDSAHDLAFLWSYFRFDLVPPSTAANGPASGTHSSSSPSPLPLPLPPRTLGDWYAAWTRADPLLFGRLHPAPPRGIRVLRQDPWETLLAFITSSANNVPRITGCLQRLAREMGPVVGVLGAPSDGEARGDLDAEMQTYHLFPSPADLLAACEPSEVTARSVAPDFARLDARLRELGFGYRAGFIASTLRTLWEAHGSDADRQRLSSVFSPPDTSDRLGIERHLASLRQKSPRPADDEPLRWRSELLSFKGVGRKVADCIGLMALDAHQAVPIDTHLQQIAARHPKFPARLKNKSTSTEKVYTEVQGFLEALWDAEDAPGMAGWAQAVMFAADLKGSTSIAPIMEDIKAKVEAVHELEVKAEAAVVEETSIASPRTPAKRRRKRSSPANDASPASTVLLTPMSSLEAESNAVDYLESGSVWDQEPPASLAESVKRRKRTKRT